MEDIQKYSEFDYDESLEIPRSLLEKWIASLKTQEQTMNQTIFVTEEMEEFLKNYYNDSEEIKELSSDDENPTFIKKFEESLKNLQN